MSDLKETNYDYIVGEQTGSLFTAEQKWISKIHKWVSEYPNDVKIITENPDGSLLVHIPKKWFKISPPRHVSDEQRQAASKRFKSMWAESNNEDSEEETEE